MKAKVIKEFSGVRTGEVYPQKIAVGELIDGDLASIAVRGKLAEAVKETVAEPAAPKKKPGKDD